MKLGTLHVMVMVKVDLYSALSQSL